MKNYTTIAPFNSREIMIVTGEECDAVNPGLRAKMMHLGDYDTLAKNLYVSPFDRGTLYKFYAPKIDYSKVDFGYPVGHIAPKGKENSKLVWYYGNKQFGAAVYDDDILSHFARECFLQWKNIAK